MPKIENLHKTKKHAFLDGVLCGIGLAFIARLIQKDYIQSKRLDALREEHARTHHS